MKLDMIGLVAGDLAASLEFYRRLGLPIPEAGPEEHHVECVVEGGLRIAWDAESMIREIDPKWQSPVGQRMSMAFLCDSPAEVDAKYQELLESGVVGYREPWDAFWGQRYAQVKDPDGNIVDLFAPLSA